MTYPEIRRALDRHILQYMVENQPGWCDPDGYAFHLSVFTNDWITKDMARAICRNLTDRGFCFYMRGLFTEDGEVAGAGYGVTENGRKYLAALFEAEE